MSNIRRVKTPELIAVTGREGSGKDTYGDYLASRGYMHISAGDVLRERARTEGYTDPIPRAVLTAVGDRLKKEFGPSPITESTIQRYEEKRDLYPAGLVISGLRRVGELKAYKIHGAVVLWIDASDKTRYTNLGRRGSTLSMDFSTFREQSDLEYFGRTQGGTNGVNIQAVEALADCRVTNDGTLDELYYNSDTALSAHPSSSLLR